ncbi:MAG: hypothetical protein PHX25_01510 [Candidatus Pacebacteria bacterium]|nr:hypothetical protein [Candidatus Paceibacterota bacterium]
MFSEALTKMIMNGISIEYIEENEQLDESELENLSKLLFDEPILVLDDYQKCKDKLTELAEFIRRS